MTQTSYIEAILMLGVEVSGTPRGTSRRGATLMMLTQVRFRLGESINLKEAEIGHCRSPWSPCSASGAQALLFNKGCLESPRTGNFHGGN